MGDTDYPGPVITGFLVSMIIINKRSYDVILLTMYITSYVVSITLSNT